MNAKLFSGRAALALAATLAVLPPCPRRADDENPAPAGATSSVHPHHGVLIQSQPGTNAWNTGHAGGDWWAEIKRQHGHVGPWNVLGWRIAQAALRELKSEWGRHELEIICYVPPQTPFTCMVDGLSVGTGNSLGRLDLRLGEVLNYRQCFVAVQRKDGRGDTLEFRPRPAYLKSIMNQPLEFLERLSRDCAEQREDELFIVQRFGR